MLIKCEEKVVERITPLELTVYNLTSAKWSDIRCSTIKNRYRHLSIPHTDVHRVEEFDGCCRTLRGKV